MLHEIKDNQHEKALKLVDDLIKNKHILKDFAGITNDYALSLIKLKEFDLADRVLDFGFDLFINNEAEKDFDPDYIILNKIQIKVHKGEELNQHEIEKLQEIEEESSDELAIMGASILLGKMDNAAKILKKHIGKTEGIIEWPIIKLMPMEIRSPIEVSAVSKTKTKILKHECTPQLATRDSHTSSIVTEN